MASCYGTHDSEDSNCRFDSADQKTQSQIINILGSRICTQVEGPDVRFQRAKEKDLPQMLALMNQIIEEGRSWPFLDKFDDISTFKAYFCSHDAFVLLESENKVVGCFYIKPNFPGRCSHICNGGFIVAPESRGKGLGKMSAQLFLKLAPLLGYKAAFFNLVFATNKVSLHMWRTMGFKEAGLIKRAARLKGEKDLVDAHCFHMEFGLGEDEDEGEEGFE